MKRDDFHRDDSTSIEETLPKNGGNSNFPSKNREKPVKDNGKRVNRVEIAFWTGTKAKISLSVEKSRFSHQAFQLDGCFWRISTFLLRENEVSKVGE